MDGRLLYKHSLQSENRKNEKNDDYITSTQPLKKNLPSNFKHYQQLTLYFPYSLL